MIWKSIRSLLTIFSLTLASKNSKSCCNDNNSILSKIFSILLYEYTSPFKSSILLITFLNLDFSYSSGITNLASLNLNLFPAFILNVTIKLLSSKYFAYVFETLTW